MPDVLIHGDTVRSPELRHEVPVAIPDPILYAERNGSRHVFVSALEFERVRAVDGLEAHAVEEFGLDELLAEGMRRDIAELEVYARACRELGVCEALVPWTFPLAVAERLREAGVAIRPERD